MPHLPPAIRVRLMTYLLGFAPHSAETRERARVAYDAARVEVPR